LTSLGLLDPGKKLLKTGVFTEAAGIGITAITGIVVGFSIMLINITSDLSLLGETGDALILDPCLNDQVFLRTQLDPATVVLAIFSGLAAGLIISKGMNISIVGVAIAASICPPATNIGILASVYLMSIFDPNLVTSGLQPVILATAFLLLNIFIINVTISIVLWAVGVATKSGVSRRRRGNIVKTNILWITMLLSVSFLLFLLFSVAFSATDYCA
jgi:uncharacterized membrane protein